MSTPKEEVRRILQRVPDDATFEDIQYHIYVLEKIEHGIMDLKKGKTMSQIEVERRMARWLGK